MNRTLTLWGIWFIATASGALVLVGSMFYGGESRATLLIGETTSGHHQIELACGACHTKEFGGTEAVEKSCHDCHGAELEKVKDSHPLKKFRDPRNAPRLEKLAANKCITCHTEHKPRVTNAMGVTLPEDYCALCHEEVFKNRPSHKGLAFSTCASAGCHNYHDNTALYEDFLEKHASTPWLEANPLSKQRTEDIEIEATGKALTAVADADAPAAHMGDHAVNADWLASSHAKAGVNCSGCHAPKQTTSETIAANWVERPGHTQCATCHEGQASSWRAGKHGMRLAESMRLETSGLFGLFTDKPLSPMRPELARLPMQSKVAHQDLTCTSCHGAHSFNTVKAQVEACTTCHADDHTQAYFGSKHHDLWKAEVAGTGEKGSGVSCASCHMPRQWIEQGYEEILITNHNQNANLRPNEKMIRSACMDCHGLGFAIDALADKSLVARNFKGKPASHIESIDWVMRRVKEREAKGATTNEKPD